MNFEEIYHTNAWSGKQTRSGPGSSTMATESVAKWLSKTMQKIGASSILDVPCGEALWVPELPGYIGIDLVEGAVLKARELHSNKPFFVADARTDRLPDTKVVFSRDFMQHLPVNEGLQVLENFRRTRATWLIASTYVDGVNEDPESSYHAYRVNLEAEPFLLTCSNTIADGYDERGKMRDPNKMIGVFTL